MSLTPGINIITGDTASGKSNIIRALVWLLYNTPNGDQFIRHGEQEAKVTAVLSNGYVVTRGKSRTGKNYYKLKSPDGTEKEFNNFGLEYPQEIKDILKVFEVRVSDKSSPVYLNLCAQLEQPFFVNDSTVSAAERAKWISLLMNINEIDKLVDDFNHDITSIKRYELKTQEELLQQKKDELKAFDSLPHKEQKLAEAKEALEELSGLCDRFNAIENLFNRLKAYRAKVQQYKRMVQSINSILRHERNVSALSEEYEKLSTLVNLQCTWQEWLKRLMGNQTRIKQVSPLAEYDMSYLQNCLDNINALNKLNSKLTTLQRRKAEIDNVLEQKAPLITQDLSKVEDAIAKLKALCSISDKWKALCNSLDDNSAKISKLKSHIDNSVQNYIILLEKSGKCPTCLTDISDDVRKHIERELKERI